MTTKLGPHVILATESAKRWAANAPIVMWAFRPPANFNLLSGEAIQEMRLQALPPARAPVVLSAARPGAITICRPIWMLTWDGRQAAEHILALYRQWGFRPTYTQLWNEFDEWGRDELRERLRQGRIAGDILRAHGCKVGDNIASTGTLEEWEWRIAAEEGFGGMDGLMLHEYWGREGFTTWHALRYRRMHDILNGNHPLVIITETGRDRVEGGNGGWKLDGINAEQYVAELKAYDAEIQKDSYILGATVFTSGPTPDWENYSMDGLEQFFMEEEPPVRILLECMIEPEQIAEGGTGIIGARVYVDGRPQPGAAVAGKIMFPFQEQAFNELTGATGMVAIPFVCRDSQPLAPGIEIPVEVWAIWSGDGVSKTISFRVGGETVPEDRIKVQLVNMWQRQGVNPNTDTDPFFAYCLEQAKTSGRAIVPMQSPDGHYLDYSDPEVIICYTIPPLWARKPDGPIMEGLPRFPLA